MNTQLNVQLKQVGVMHKTLPSSRDCCCNYEHSVERATETSGGDMNTPSSHRVELMNSSVLVDRTSHKRGRPWNTS